MAEQPKTDIDKQIEKVRAQEVFLKSQRDMESNTFGKLVSNGAPADLIASEQKIFEARERVNAANSVTLSWDESKLVRQETKPFMDQLRVQDEKIANKLGLQGSEAKAHVDTMLRQQQEALAKYAGKDGSLDAMANYVKDQTSAIQDQLDGKITRTAAAQAPSQQPAKPAVVQQPTSQQPAKPAVAQAAPPSMQPTKPAVVQTPSPQAPAKAIGAQAPNKEPAKAAEQPKTPEQQAQEQLIALRLRIENSQMALSAIDESLGVPPGKAVDKLEEQTIDNRVAAVKYTNDNSNLLPPPPAPDVPYKLTPAEQANLDKFNAGMEKFTSRAAAIDNQIAEINRLQSNISSATEAMRDVIGSEKGRLSALEKPQDRTVDNLLTKQTDLDVARRKVTEGVFGGDSFISKIGENDYEQKSAQLDAQLTRQRAAAEALHSKDYRYIEKLQAIADGKSGVNSEYDNAVAKRDMTAYLQESKGNETVGALNAKQTAENKSEGKSASLPNLPKEFADAKVVGGGRTNTGALVAVIEEASGKRLTLPVNKDGMITNNAQDIKNLAGQTIVAEVLGTKGKDSKRDGKVYEQTYDIKLDQPQMAQAPAPDGTPRNAAGKPQQVAKG